MPSSVMLGCVALVITEVSEERITSMIIEGDNSRRARHNVRSN
jgi:hypothetical protein